MTNLNVQRVYEIKEETMKDHLKLQQQEDSQNG